MEAILDNKIEEKREVRLRRIEEVKLGFKVFVSCRLCLFLILSIYSQSLQIENVLTHSIYAYSFFFFSIFFLSFAISRIIKKRKRKRLNRTIYREKNIQTNAKQQ